MIEQEEFLEIIKLLEENYNKKLPDSIVGIWYEEFKTYSLENFKAKVIECIKEYNYFPTINQVKNIQIKKKYDTKTIFHDDYGYYKLTEDGKRLVL